MEVCMMMFRMRIATALFLVAIPIFLSDCNNPPPPVNQPGTEETLAPDFSISRRDSMLVLTLADGLPGKIEKKSLSINGSNIAYNSAAENLEIPFSKVRPGSNRIIFHFVANQKEDSLVRDYFNMVDLEYKIVNTFAHNRKNFTQGFLFDQGGNLMEATGLEGRSKIMRYMKTSNGFKVKDSAVNAPNEFGEGIAIFHNQLVQLLWQNRYIKIYDPRSLRFIRNLEYAKEGWGICTDGKTLYASDGSDKLHVINIDGAVVNIERSIPVRDEQGAVLDINELEYVNGYIFANIWRTDRIVIINPETGSVCARLDLTAIANKERLANQDIDVLNGIAYNPASKTFFITGKDWSGIYELRIQPEISK